VGNAAPSPTKRRCSAEDVRQLREATDSAGNASMPQWHMVASWASSVGSPLASSHSGQSLWKMAKERTGANHSFVDPCQNRRMSLPACCGPDDMAQLRNESFSGSARFGSNSVGSETPPTKKASMPTLASAYSWVWPLSPKKDEAADQPGTAQAAQDSRDMSFLQTIPVPKSPPSMPSSNHLSILQTSPGGRSKQALSSRGSHRALSPEAQEPRGPRRKSVDLSKPTAQQPLNESADLSKLDVYQGGSNRQLLSSTPKTPATPIKRQVSMLLPPPAPTSQQDLGESREGFFLCLVRTLFWRTSIHKRFSSTRTLVHHSSSFRHNISCADQPVGSLDWIKNCIASFIVFTYCFGFLVTAVYMTVGYEMQGFHVDAAPRAPPVSLLAAADEPVVYEGAAELSWGAVFVSSFWSGEGMCVPSCMLLRFLSRELHY